VNVMPVKTKAKPKAARKTKATLKASKVIKATTVSKKKSTLSADKYFYLNNGDVISNLKDLPKVLAKMDDATFSYHVTDAKNDFSSWINDVFGKSKLAVKIGSMKNRDEMVSTLKKDIK